MSNPRRVYWDACAWIALIQQERMLNSDGTLFEDRYGMCRNVINAAERNHIEIATSTLSLVEVCKASSLLQNIGEDKIATFFENDYVLLVNLDRAVGEMARKLMRSGFSLKPPDACHLATAALAFVDEAHTFDRKLLGLDGLIDKPDGTKLKIVKPDPGGIPAPLFDKMKSGDERDE